MRTPFLFLGILCLLGGFAPKLAMSQVLTQTIRGTVQDADTKLPLAGATVAIPVLKMGAYTEENGTFRIDKIPLGRHTLVISYLGYETQTIPNIVVTSAKERVMILELIESVMEMEAVVITGSEDKAASINELSVVSTRAFTVDETKHYAGSFDDPSRMALSFAGVAASDDDGNNEIIVRGNSPRFMLWRIEGVEVPSPNHFTDQGASSGAVSILSSNMLANSDFSTGAFQAEYGNALSGVFDIHLRKGNNEKREYAFQLGVLGADFAAEGPFKKGYDGSYLVNYRYSTLAILNNIGVLNIVGGSIPVFQDLSFKLHLPTTKYGNFSVWGIGGLSSIDEEGEGYMADSTIGVVWKDRFVSNMSASGVKHRILLGNKTVLNSSVAFTASSIGYENESVQPDNQFVKDYTEDFRNYSTKVQSIATHKFNAKNLLKAGVYFTRQSYDLNAQYLDDSTNLFVPELAEKGGATTWQGFATYRYRFNEKLSVNAGLHAMYFGLNDQLSLEPRASLKYQVSPKGYFSAGFGVHSRRPDLAVFLARQTDENGVVTQPNLDLDLIKARHYVVGYDHMFNKDLHFRVEAYYQDLYQVPVLNDSTFSSSLLNSTAGFSTENFVNEGTGKNYGLELTLEKFFSNNYFFLLTGSLFESKYTGKDGIEFNTRFNGNYVGNVMIGKEFPVGKSGDNRITTSFRAIVAGGKRYTPVDIEASKAMGYTVRHWDRRFEEQAPTWFRPDLSVSYVMNRKNTTHTFRLEVQNVIARTNVVNRFYDTRTQEMRDDTRGDLIPILSYKLHF